MFFGLQNLNRLQYSVWPDGKIISNIRTSTRIKTCPIAYFFAKVGLKFCQILNKASKVCPRLLKLCQSDEISSNLVTLAICNIFLDAR